MDYDQTINDIVTFLKQDKRVIQPWRNYALKHLQEGMASVCMGLTTTNRQPPDGITQAAPPVAPVFPRPHPLGCICSDDMPQRRDCVVHGTAQ